MLFPIKVPHIRVLVGTKMVGLILKRTDQIISSIVSLQCSCVVFFLIVLSFREANWNFTISSKLKSQCLDHSQYQHQSRLRSWTLENTM